MLVNTKDADLYLEWQSYIDEESVQNEFRLLVGFAVCSEDLKCLIKWKGVVREFCLLDEDDRQIFAFITNKKSLRFYFKTPAIRSGRFHWKQ